MNLVIPVFYPFAASTAPTKIWSDAHRILWNRYENTNLFHILSTTIQLYETLYRKIRCHNIRQAMWCRQTARHVGETVIWGQFTTAWIQTSCSAVRPSSLLLLKSEFLLLRCSASLWLTWLITAAVKSVSRPLIAVRRWRHLPFRKTIGAEIVDWLGCREEMRIT